MISENNKSHLIEEDGNQISNSTSMIVLSILHLYYKENEPRTVFEKKKANKTRDYNLSG